VSALPTFPLVGREPERALLRAMLDRLRHGTAGDDAIIILAGDGGTGKTRLAEAAAADAEERGFTVGRGRAYPMEAGVPYALFSDALLPLLRQYTPEQLSLLARGGEAELAHVFPALLAGSRPRAAVEDPVEVKARVLWTMAQLVTGIARTAPLLLVLDDLHAADPASLEMLHFLARQTELSRVAFLCTYNESERRSAPALRQLEQSLLSLGVASLHHLAELSLADTTELLRLTFDVDPSFIGEFPRLLYDSTRGNAFFIQETLRTLVEQGQLRFHDGAWTGWDVEQLELPATIREAVTARIDRLSDAARDLASVLATLGTRADHELIAGLADADEATLLQSLDELRRAEVITESSGTDGVEYDFAHPMLRQAVYAELGLARSRKLHGSIADALEARYGARAADYAGELAYHLTRSGTGARAPRAARYLVEAGRAALDRYANREAADYLTLAVQRLEETGSDPAEQQAAAGLLARAQQRLGEYESAIAIWRRLLREAESAGAAPQAAAARRGLGLALLWRGRHADALTVFRDGASSAREAGDERLEARLRLGAASCLQELGRASEAAAEGEAVLVLAERLEDAGLQSRAHRALLLVYTWTGPPVRARGHGARALELATVNGESDIAFSCHWALAVLEGLTGRSSVMREHIDAAESIAQELRSPLFSLATAELYVEYLWSTGDWDRAVATGERAIGLARSLNQAPLLTRLLVWTAMLYLGRGDHERAGAYVDEAWELSDADHVNAAEPIDVHRAVPAHIGRAAYHLSLGEFREAIRIGEAGLEIADSTGYIFWAIHRLLPIVTESYCHLFDIEGALRCEARLRRDSQRLEHTLGLAWADTSRAIVQWLRGDLEAACTMLRDAAASLEAIPIVPEAARLRRQLAGRLADIGDREGALRELRHVHDVFVHLGAEPELNKARGQFRELGAKPPLRSQAEGAEGMTGREIEIARLAAAGQSNKAIGRVLDISPRTVSTHLSNIFRKVGVASRADLADYVRSGRLPTA
jgi:ATP/maltotriose-dependent transcriptional regulator MalT